MSASAAVVGPWRHGRPVASGSPGASWERATWWPVQVVARTPAEAYCGSWNLFSRRMQTAGSLQTHVRVSNSPKALSRGYPLSRAMSEKDGQCCP